jgi:glycosyltransferase involved in cell wall biosynthesis/carbonic anhydrase/acetyltransferase-like protein (isoleucine patch superfamily)
LAGPLSDHGIPTNPYNPHCWITGEPEIGEGTWIGAFTLVDGIGGLTIGRGCDIASGAQILSHSTVRRCLAGRRRGRIDSMPTVIEDHVFVGTNAVVLMGCHIGHHSIVAAGAVVPEGSRIPPYSLVAGVPARVLRSVESEVRDWSTESAMDPPASQARPCLSIITFFLNEADNLPHLKERLFSVLDRSEMETECVLVDDHSTDASREIALRWVAERPRTTYLRLSRNFGSHAAIAAGLKYATGDCAVVMAADLQDPPEVIPALLERWREGNDVVWACRSGRAGESPATRAASKIYYRLMRWFALPEMPAEGADFVLLGRSVIDAYNAIAEKHTSVFAVILWMGFRQSSVAYVKQARHAGQSRWTPAKKLRLAIDSIVSFSDLPIRALSLLGLLMATGGLLYGAIVVVGRLSGRAIAGTGFAALMTALLVGQGLILIMLGILGEYLWRTFDQVRGRPKFIIETRRSEALTDHEQS